MKLFYLFSLFILIGSCSETVRDNNGCRIIKSNLQDESSCERYYQVNNCFEDTSNNRTLSCFLVNVLIGGDLWAENYNYNSLFNSLEFVDIILMFYKGKLNHLKNTEDESDWEDSFRELLIKCENKDVLFKISDSLLSINNADGIVTMWDDDIIKRLSNYSSYNEYVRHLNDDGLYTKVQLCIIAHNIIDLENRDLLLKQIKEIDSLLGQRLEERIKQSGKIDYDFYENLFYE